jgi:hypothetical protein
MQGLPMCKAGPQNVFAPLKTLPTLSAVAKLDASINVGTEARWVHFGAQLCSSGGNFSACAAAFGSFGRSVHAAAMRSR